MIEQSEVYQLSLQMLGLLGNWFNQIKIWVFLESIGPKMCPRASFILKIVLSLLHLLFSTRGLTPRRSEELWSSIKWRTGLDSSCGVLKNPPCWTSSVAASLALPILKKFSLFKIFCLANSFKDNTNLTTMSLVEKSEITLCFCCQSQPKNKIREFQKESKSAEFEKIRRSWVRSRKNRREKINGIGEERAILSLCKASESGSVLDHLKRNKNKR